MNTKKIIHLINVRKVSIVAGIAAGSICMTNCAQANILVDAASGVIGKIRYNTTVAELVVSLLAGNGAAVTNNSWLNQLNASYGIESSIGTLTGTDGSLGAMYEAGLFDIAADGTFIDNGLLSAIESQPAYTNCNIDDIFGTWNNAEGVAEVSGSVTLGSAIGAGTTFGSLCQVAGAFTAGVHLGILANKIVDWVGSKIRTGQFINSSTNLDDISVPNGLNFAWVRSLNGAKRTSTFAYSSNIIPFLVTYPYNSGTTISPCFYLSDTSQEYTLKYGNKNNTYDTFVNPSNNSSFNTGERITYTYILNERLMYEQSGFNVLNFNSHSDYLNWVSSVNNGSIVPTGAVGDMYSPDIIGANGNQRAVNVDGTTIFPNIGNQLPQDKGIEPIPWSDYTQYVDTANNNTTNNNTIINQGDTYNDFINNYIVTPDVTPAPDVEKPNYNPTVPEQPTPNEKDELTSEQSKENTDYMTTPGLKDVFPFCIPFDIVSAIKILNTQGRQAPKITARFYFPPVGIDYNMEIDLSRFDEIATILRGLELIGFVIGLAFVTRNLIGAR